MKDCEINNQLIYNYEYGATAVFLAPPKPAGAWKVTESFQISCEKKPSEKIIRNHEKLLGWEWVDY